MFGLQFVNEMENVQREIDQLFRGFGFTSTAESQIKQIDFQVIDNGESFSVQAPLPGLDSEKLDISVLGRIVTVSGEFSASEVSQNVRWHHQERCRGEFEQNIQLRANLDTEKIEAEYVDGILNITLPKAVSELPKKIAVKVN
ncbi:MAG: Hsp20/alpha crystallin family protein [Desulfuromusa sp.]